MNEKQQNIADRVTARINSGEIVMRPRLFFVAKTVGIVLLGLGVFFTSALIVNFILFTIHVNSNDSLLQFGPRGWTAFMFFFPWKLLGIDLLFIGLLTILLKQFRVGYRMPRAYIVIIVLILISISGVFIERHTHANRYFTEGRGMGERSGFPLRGMMHSMRDLPNPDEGICRCRILEISDSSHLVLEDTNTGREIVGVLTPTTRGDVTLLEQGDMVFVAGDYIDGTIDIFGIHKIGRR